MGNTLYWMVTIADRNQGRKFISFYQNYGVTTVFSTLGRGTAASDVLNYFGLEATQKVILFSAVTDSVWTGIKKGLQSIMQIDIPGTGIAFIIPMSSIGGKRQLQFLTGSQNFTKGAETVLKDTKHELLVVIANQGYTEMIMDAARKGNAGGGTVIHAKGTGMEGAEKFLGVSLAAEKELILIVVRHEDKNAVMSAIMQDAGLESRAKSIVFSLPVTSTAGLRLSDLSDADE
ncbi:MAG: P-II family nitrogen regulator [Hominenteromicrobium sp.]